MQKLKIVILFLFIAIVSMAQDSSLSEFLKDQGIVKEMKVIPGNAFFNETYQIMVRQPLDHSDTTKGFFLQRVFVADKGIQNPVLLITEGYGAEYATSPRYLNELSPMLNSNQICVEHRYFGKSWPSPLNWDYLTVQQVAEDHHAIVELFKKHYSGKWVNTGISKGGQTAVYHRAFFPNDVDVTVAYVAPLNFAVEDGRHEPFLAKVPGTAVQREKIEQFQLDVLKNRESIVPKLEEYSIEKNYSFRIPMDEVLDYCVLEYPFALWQWGRHTDQIPEKTASVDQLFDHLMLVSNPSYFAVEGMDGIKSFFVQAARELGYYGYDTKPLRKYLSIKNSKDYIARIFLPEDLEIKYDKSTAKKVKKFIQRTDAKIIFVYGEFDPWTASGFEVPNSGNFLKIVNPGGSHSSRINNLPTGQKQLIETKLTQWLGRQVQIK